MGIQVDEVVEMRRRAFFQSRVWVVVFWKEGMEKVFRLPEAVTLMTESMFGALRDGFQVAMMFASWAIAEVFEWEFMMTMET